MIGLGVVRPRKLIYSMDDNDLTNKQFCINNKLKNKRASSRYKIFVGFIMVRNDILFFDNILKMFQNFINFIKNKIFKKKIIIFNFGTSFIELEPA